VHIRNVNEKDLLPIYERLAELNRKVVSVLEIYISKTEYGVKNVTSFRFNFKIVSSDVIGLLIIENGIDLSGYGLLYI
jgi:hypothetical protein